MTNANGGEWADYEFSFKSTADFVSGESIEIYFPDEYDPFVGHAMKWFNSGSNPSAYYLKCSSTALGLVWCTVDKWKVTIMASSENVTVVAGTAIDITLHYVSNPLATNAAVVQPFILSIYNASNVLTAVKDDAFTKPTLVDPASDIIDIKSVMVSNTDLFSTSSTYNFAFYLEDSTNTWSTAETL